MPVGTNVYIDGVIFYSSIGINSYTVLSNGINVEGNIWTYSGSGTFLGFSTTQGSTTPDADFEIGDYGTYSADLYLYSVAQQTPAISDLTGYTWVANDGALDISTATYSINFTSNNQNFTSLVSTRQSTFLRFMSYGDLQVYESGTWSNVAYKTITITGGTDATNSTLIAWLEANGTLIEPTTPSSKISIGNLSISKMSVGTSDVASMWLGSEKVYEKQ